ncbi:MAG: T9SS type A sorting domain-containing protein [Chitinophagales bacterium]
MNIYNILFLCFFSICITTTKNINAQIIEAGPYKAYLDGLSAGIVTNGSVAYISSSYGTARLNLSTKEFFYLQDVNPAIPASYFLSKGATVDHEGRLWAILNHQLVNIDENGTINYVALEPDYPTILLRTDNDNRIWAGFNAPYEYTPNDVAIGFFNGTEWEYRSLPEDTYNKTISDIAFDSNNNPFVATNGYGIYKFDGLSPVYLGYGAKSLDVSNDGQIACSGGYLSDKLFYWNNTGKQVSVDDGYRFPLFDENNLLWVEHDKGHIYNISEGFDEPVKMLNPPANYRTNGAKHTENIVFDKEGQLWLGNQDGLFVAPNPQIDEWEPVLFNDLKIPQHVSDVTSNQDTVWMLTSGKLTRLVNDGFEEMEVDAIEGKIKFTQYDEYRKGLWIATNNTLNLMVGEEFTAYDLTPFLTDAKDRIESIKTDQLGNVWLKIIGEQNYNNRGVIHIDPSDSLKKYFLGEEIPICGETSLWYSLHPSDGSVWIQLSPFSSPTSCAERRIRIKDGVITDLDLELDMLDHAYYDSMTILSDDLVFIVHSDKIIVYNDGQKIESEFEYIQLHETYAYNDSTLLICSQQGLYIVSSNGKWVKPEIPSNRIFNTDAYPSHLSTDNKLVVGYRSLMVVEDMTALMESIADELYTSIDNPSASNRLHLYPNPFSEFLYPNDLLQWDCNDCELNIYDSNGQQVKHLLPPFSYRIVLEDILPGMYLFQLKKAGEVVGTQKLMRY